MANFDLKLFTNFILIVTTSFIIYSLINTHCECICCNESTRYIDRDNDIQYMCFNHTTLYTPNKCNVGPFSIEALQFYVIIGNILFLVIVNSKNCIPQLSQECFYAVVCFSSVIVFLLLATVSQNGSCRSFGDQYSHCLAYTRLPR